MVARVGIASHSRCYLELAKMTPTSMQPAMVDKAGRTLPPTPQPVGQLSFVDANNGWAIGSSDVTPGNTKNQPPNLLHTTNGGRTWQQITAVLQNVKSPPSAGKPNNHLRRTEQVT